MFSVVETLLCPRLADTVDTSTPLTIDCVATVCRYGIIMTNGYRLSLGGTSHVALFAFLERHPEIKRVTLYMDNDLAGLKNARKIKAMLRENPSFKHIRVGINPPREGKDYNEKLMSKLQLLQNLPQRRREKRAAISI